MSFREHLYPPEHPRIAELRGLDAYAYVPHARHDAFTGTLIEGWKLLSADPYVGTTSDGRLIPGLFPLQEPEDADAAPVAAMVAAAERLLDGLDAAQRARIVYPVDSIEWRHWANPEFLQFDTGLRLEFQPAAVRERFLALVEASLSPRGAADVRTMMRINGFLGEVVGLPGIMNEFSYNASIFGTPSLTEPWGWQLFGHHCAVNCLVVGGQLVVSPVFLGAEPNEIDAGPHAGTVAFVERIALGRRVLDALSDAQRAVAITAPSLTDLPPGRIHPGDERHLAGAFQDNRVIPYEGVRVAELDPSAQERVWELVADFVSILPDGPARLRMREIRAQLADTWFSWIGGSGPDDPYYCRVQSPVVIVEIDHHCGVFLTNDTPQPFHIHTVMRTPNGNDYGHALVRQARAPR
ncbi:DUF3500 domain-containing protein [Leucobacter allii]|uniref:DUF3500 domain-containing protein n=1 Tax=Leucobacter allii TaxID=2932247 RepID=UPI001FD0E039|nr:DUF3500 domain-containing protein [Leucobacter allii]UOR01142.1 DUF3500 domain-containing protein [Leucobacter allii]